MPHQQPFRPNPGQPQPIYVPSPQPKPHRYFRWWIVFVPVIVLLIFWVIHRAPNIGISSWWEEVMDSLNVHDRERYTSLAILGVLIVAAVGLVRLLRGPGKGDGDGS